MPLPSTVSPNLCMLLPGYNLVCLFWQWFCAVIIYLFTVTNLTFLCDPRCSGSFTEWNVLCIGLRFRSIGRDSDLKMGSWATIIRPLHPTWCVYIALMMCMRHFTKRWWRQVSWRKHVFTFAFPGWIFWILWPGIWSKYSCAVLQKNCWSCLIVHVLV